MVRGGRQYYTIEYSVDIKGKITIWGGGPRDEAATEDLFCNYRTEDGLHLYDGGRHGREFVRMEREAASKVTREELIQAFLEFRRLHPRDGYGLINGIGRKWASGGGDGLSSDDFLLERIDKEAVLLELKKRNREYIEELYGEKIPLDFDFRADYDRRLEERFKNRN